MDTGRFLLAAMAVLMLALPPAAAISPEDNDPGGPGARGTFSYRPGESNITELKASGNVYTNSSASFPIPSNASIISASIDLEGSPVVGPNVNTVADFSSSDSNYKAYKGTYTSSSPGNTKPMTFIGTEFVSYEYNYIANSDGTYQTQWAYYYNNEYAYHHFSFKLPIDITSKVTVHWEGFGGYYYYGTGSCAVYLWNNLGSWESVGTGSGTSVQTIEKTFNGNYIDSQHTVHVLAMGTGGQYYYNIQTDYVRVTVDGNVLTYPKNPSMDLGATGKIDWSLTEPKFNYWVSVGDASLITKINAIVKNAPSQYVYIKMRLNSETIGKIKITNVTVTYTAPPWCKGIPSTSNMDEDVNAERLIELNQYWTDDVVGSRLSYEVIYQQDPKKLEAAVNADGHSLDFKLKTKNWYGTLGFCVRATDSDGMSRESNTFSVTVNPVNDPPVFVPISRQMATQGVLYTYTVKARDVDMDLDQTEEIVFADNATIFDIDPVTGAISLTPTQQQVGVYNIGLTVTDRMGDMDFENFTMEIQDAEDPPVIDPIQEQTANEGLPFTITATASDPDVPYGDVLTFSDNSPLFVIDPTTGEMSFTPTTKEIGVHQVTVTVRDRGGMSDNTSFIVSVLNSIGNLDRPPSIEPIANQTAQEGSLFELMAKATDPDLDLGDSITFSDNVAFFDINPNTGRIAYTPAAKDTGVFKVKVTVKDRDGLLAYTEFWLTVLKTNHAPVISQIQPADGAKVQQDKRVLLSASASDRDGDRLNYTWKDGETVLGYGANTTVVFSEPGSYIITLIVTDGKLEAVNETMLEVAEPSGGGGGGGSGTPGFEGPLAVAALSAAFIGLALRRKRR